MNYNHDKIIAPFNLEIEVKYNIVHQARPVIIISNGYSVFNFDGMFAKLIIQLCEENNINWVQYLYAEKNKVNELDDLFPSSGYLSLSSVHNWVKRNHDGKAGLLGLSFGGNISLEYALNNSEIDFLLLFNPVIDYPAYRLKQLGEDGLKKWEEYKYLMLDYAGNKLRSSYRFMEEVKKQDMVNRIDQISIPVTVFQGKLDPILYPDNLAHYQKFSSLQELYMIENGKHELSDRKALDELMPHLSKTIQSLG